jgi:TPR repeat protein
MASDVIKRLLQSTIAVICCLASTALAEAPPPSFDQGAALYRNQNYAAALPIFLSVYRLAAEAGHAPAQYQMGVMLRDGEGVTPNEAAALRWFQQAAQNGYDKARLVIEDLTPGAALVSNPDEPMPQRTEPWNFELPASLSQPLMEQAISPPQSSFERGFRVQLAAMRSKEAAIDLWEFLKQEFPRLTSSLPYTVSVFEPDDQSPTLYRLRVGDFRSEQSARRFCDIIAPITRRTCWLIND